MKKEFLRALAIAVPAGALCAWLRTPLPWMIGPLVACAIASGNGVRLACPVHVRLAGQWAIGTALGLYFTPEVVARVAAHWWPVIAGTAWSLALGLAVAWSLRRFADADPATAFFAGAVGGASEMALQGERSGGRVETIAAAHSLRIMMVVIAVPFAFRWLGIHGSDAYLPGARVVDPAGLAALVAVTSFAGFALQRTRSPNAWVIGPLLACGLLTGFGVTLSALPQWVVNAGQVAIGTALGTRFLPGFFKRAPRFLTVVFVSGSIGLVASAAFAVLLGWLSGIPSETLVLATAPGGIAEMSLTARVLQLGVPVVTIFHVTRLVTLVLVGGALYRWLADRLGWTAGEPQLVAGVQADDA
jgi:uncharacterized protein